MGEINAWHLQLLAGDVFPNIKFCPIADGKYTDISRRMDACVVQIPKFRTLVFRVPWPNSSPERKYPLLGSGLFFVTARPTYTGIELELRNGIQERH